MKKGITFLILVSVVMGCVASGAVAEDKTGGVAQMDDLNNKKIVMIIAAHDFRDEELNIPLGYFETKGAAVDVASSVTTEVTGMLGARVTPNMLYTDIDSTKYDAIVFVGGGGATQYWHDTVAHKIAQDGVAAGKIVAAICYAPVTLANAGVLKDKKVTVWPDDTTLPEFEKAGITATESDVEVDGNIVTGIGPKAAYKFAREIERLLVK